ncbi:MAG: IPT/TIG domain-containing protein [Thermomicrobiales bacterium]
MTRHALVRTARLLALTAALLGPLFVSHPAAAANLNGEGFTITGSSSPSCLGSGSSSYTASGSATGPYPGTFTETGTLTINNAGGGGVTGFTGSYTITSGVHTITGNLSFLSASGGACRQDSDTFSANAFILTYYAALDGTSFDSGYSTVARLGVQGGMATVFSQNFQTSITSEMIFAVAGDNKSATAGTAFGTALKVKLLDAANNPISGHTVFFAAPQSGPRGTFEGGQASASMVTDSQGVATAPTFTATTTAGGPYTVTARDVTAASPYAVFHLTNTADAATAIATAAGDSQRTAAGTAFGIPLQALLTDQFGNGVPGASVTFIAMPQDGDASFPGGQHTAVTSTDGQGIATAPTLTAGTTPGGVQATATTAGVASSAMFALSVTPGAATHFAVSAPACATAGEACTVTLTAIDTYGNTATGYTGTIRFTSTDDAAALPADYPFSGSGSGQDNGVHLFTVALRTAGTQMVTMADTGNSALTARVTATIIPIVSTVGPASGGTAGGNHVTLTGLGFGSDAGNVIATIGDMSAPVVSVTNTQLVVTVPAHVAGTVSVVVTVNGQSATVTNGYTYGMVNALPPSKPPGGVGGSPGPLPQARPAGVAQSSPNPLPAPRP